MKFVAETIKIILLSLIAVLLSIDLGIVTLPTRAEVMARLGVSSNDAAGPIGLETEGEGETKGEVPEAAALAHEAPVDGVATPESEILVLADHGGSAPVEQNEVVEAAVVDAEEEARRAAPAVDPQLGSAARGDGGTESAEGFAYSSVADQGLEALLRQRLASRYEFPEHVKFRHAHLTVRRLFADAGIDVEREQEVVFAVYCGDYSAPNAAGLYGAYRPFFAEVLVNHADQSIDGELWLDVDGDIKKSISFRSDLLISARQESFDSRFHNYCGSREGFLPGEYADYKTGQLAPYYRQHFAEIESKASDPDYAARLVECLKTEATLKECYRAVGG